MLLTLYYVFLYPGYRFVLAIGYENPPLLIQIDLHSSHPTCQPTSGGGYCIASCVTVISGNILFPIDFHTVLRVFAAGESVRLVLT